MKNEDVLHLQYNTRYTYSCILVYIPLVLHRSKHCHECETDCVLSDAVSEDPGGVANADAALLALVQVDVVESTEEDILFSLSLYVKNGISQYIEMVGF